MVKLAEKNRKFAERSTDAGVDLEQVIGRDPLTNLFNRFMMQVIGGDVVEVGRRSAKQVVWCETLVGHEHLLDIVERSSRVGPMVSLAGLHVIVAVIISILINVFEN